MQVRVGGGVTREGWTGHDLVTDRRLCFRAGLHILRSSFGVCHALPVDDRLSAYATGHCFADAADLALARREGARLARGPRSAEGGAHRQLNAGAGQPCLYRWKSATVVGPERGPTGHDSRRARQSSAAT